MDKEEFQKKYHIQNNKITSFLKLLDVLYLEFTEKQCMEMIKDYYENANTIYNDSQNFQ